jgi:hypothetical protein
MQIFSELLDIDSYITVKLQLEPVHVPNVRLTINQQLVRNGVLSDSMSITHKQSLLSLLCIEIELLDKDYATDSISAIVIPSLKIDHFDLVPSWTHLAHYQNDHNCNDPTNYLGFNGKWRLEIDKPFYQWIHQVQGNGWLFEP